jgi:hypothetical protein
MSKTEQHVDQRQWILGQLSLFGAHEKVADARLLRYGNFVRAMKLHDCSF